MANKLKINRLVLMCSYLLASPSGRDALSCCRRDLTDGSSSCELSDPPDPSCETQWSADGVAVVDESGGVDESRVHRAASQSIVLRGKHTDVIFWMDCDPPKKSEEVYCTDLCPSSDDFSPAPERSQLTHRPENTANRSPSDGIIFIFLPIIIIFIISCFL